MDCGNVSVVRAWGVELKQRFDASLRHFEDPPDPIVLGGNAAF